MRMSVEIEGGLAYFPGLAQPIVLDTDNLPSEDAEELKRLVQATHFFELPRGGEQKSAPLGADYRRYTITIDDGLTHHSVQRIDPVTDPHLQDLLTFAQRHRSSSR
jgi:hypothetical protein